jgi:hypothetical protein
MNFKNYNVIKSIFIIAFILYFIGILAAHESPAIEYEYSIYSSTPFLFWVSIVINLIVGISIILLFIESKNHQELRFVMIGFFLLILSYTAILSLWIIRGYTFLDSGDPLVHLKLIKQIFETGQINTFYPIVHIFFVQLSLFGNLPPMTIGKYLPLIVSIYSIIFLFLFIREILPKKGQQIFALLAGMILISNNSYLLFTPNRLANLIIPLALFLIFVSLKTKRFNWTFLLIIIALLFPVLHIVPTIFITLTLFCFVIYGGLISVKNFRFLTENIPKISYLVIPLLFIIIWSLFWVYRDFHFSMFIESLDSISTLYVSHPSQELSRYLLRLIKGYLGFIVFLTFSLLSILLIFRKRVNRQKTKLPLLYFPIFFILLIVLISYFFNLYFNPFDRFQIFIIFLSTPFVGYILYYLIESRESLSDHWITPKKIFILIFLISFSIFGVAKVYQSDFVYNNNDQISQNQILGMDWFVHQKDFTGLISGISATPGTFGGVLLSTTELTSRQDLYSPRGIIKEELFLPPHLGYYTHNQIKEIRPINSYIIIQQQDRMLFSWGPDKEYLPEDFSRMNSDESLECIYKNGGFDVFYLT